MSKLSEHSVKRLGVAAFAVGALAAAPSVAQASHEPSSLPVCPKGAPLQGTVDTACEVARGVENSVKHGGTVAAVNEFADRQVRNGVTNGNGNGNSSTTKKLADSAKAGVVDKTLTGAATLKAGVESSLGKINVGNPAGRIDQVEAMLDPGSGTSTCPSALPTGQPVPSGGRTVDRAAKAACSALGQLLRPPNTGEITTFLSSLGIGAAVDGIGKAAGPFIDAELTIPGLAVEALDKAGSGTVRNAYEAAQCIRKGDYGNEKRKTPCPQ